MCVFFKKKRFKKYVKLITLGISSIKLATPIHVQPQTN